MNYFIYTLHRKTSCKCFGVFTVLVQESFPCYCVESWQGCCYSFWDLTAPFLRHPLTLQLFFCNWSFPVDVKLGCVCLQSYINSISVLKPTWHNASKRCSDFNFARHVLLVIWQPRDSAPIHAGCSCTHLFVTSLQNSINCQRLYNHCVTTTCQQDILFDIKWT